MSVPSRFCPNCGKPVAMEAKFCPSCGATIPTAQAPPPVQPQAPVQPAYPSYGPSYQTPYQQPYAQQPVKKSNTKMIIAIVIIVVVIVAGLGTYAAYSFFNTLPNLTTQHSLSIASNRQLTVPGGQYYYFNVTLPPTAFLITVNGTFTSNGTVQVLVMDDANYITFHNGGTGNYLYNSGPTLSGTITANPPTAGTYHLVYSNSGSTTITVTTTATAYYR